MIRVPCKVCPSKTSPEGGFSYIQNVATLNGGDVSYVRESAPPLDILDEKKSPTRINFAPEVVKVGGGNFFCSAKKARKAWQRSPTRRLNIGERLLFSVVGAFKTSPLNLHKCLYKYRKPACMFPDRYNLLALRSLPNPTLPYPTLPCPTLPYPILPYPSIPNGPPTYPLPQLPTYIYKPTYPPNHLPTHPPTNLPTLHYLTLYPPTHLPKQGGAEIIRDTGRPRTAGSYCV